MAEVLINNEVDGWNGFSAGVEPSKVNRRAIQVMEEMGYSMAGTRSKGVEEFLNREDLDLVVTVCDHAKETCPVFYSPVEQVHLGFEDPVEWTDHPDEIALPKFRAVRDDIRERLLPYLESLASK